MEKFDLENFPTSESAKKMLSCVSDGFYDKSYVGKWLFQVMGAEYDKALEIVENLPAQFFPETATWGLMYHEIKWGLPIRLNLPYEERRRLICLKRDYRAPMTPYRMERYLENATGFGVHIADVNDSGDYGFVAPHPNVFKVYFIGEGSLNSKLVHEILNRLKQSHTVYSINDRVEVKLRNMERIVLCVLKMHIQIGFFYAHMLNGAWRLDGSVLLNSHRRYNLAHKLEMHYRHVFQKGEIWVSCVHLGSWVENTNEVRHVREMLRYGTVSLQAPKIKMIGLHMDIPENRNEVAVKLDIKRNVWRLDGTIKLDGMRKLNAMYIKEEL